MYVEKKFRVCTRRLQRFTNKDFERVIPVIKEKDIKSKEKDSFGMAEHMPTISWCNRQYLLCMEVR
jgi:hypothetical protein